MNTAATMRWVCTVCGYVHEGPEPPEECPVCGAGPDLFEAEAEPGTTDSASPGTPAPEEYLAAWARDTDGFETKFARIKALASGAPCEI